MFIKDNDNKAKLQLHIVPGAFVFSKIKTNMWAKIGKIGEPVTSLTKFGWMIMSPGQKEHSNMYLTQTTTHNYEKLY